MKATNREVARRSRCRKGKKWETGAVGGPVGEVSRDICVPGRTRPVASPRETPGYGLYESFAIGDSHTTTSTTLTRGSTVSASLS